MSIYEKYYKTSYTTNVCSSSLDCVEILQYKSIVQPKTETSSKSTFQSQPDRQCNKLNNSILLNFYIHLLTEPCPMGSYPPMSYFKWFGGRKILSIKFSNVHGKMSPQPVSFCRYFLICVLIILLNNASTQDVEESEMEKFKVVPDVIDKTPNDDLEVSYCVNKVEMGNKLTPTDVKNAPTVKWNAEKESFYTLIMIDPDAPCASEPTLREYQHWLVVNIPGHKVTDGQTLTEYVGAFPSKPSGSHRYVFLVYKQPDEIQFEEKKISRTNGSKRGQFSARTFAKKYKLGCPIAGNFFRAKWDPYVSTIEEQLEN
ncbi:hypothetical protein FQR65_LT04289 [Abscondita terminalis]|nr:hypothetical protein FQR65_LT04289 [Abscondita terminalis]